MKTIIYYFSATGNSLQLARTLTKNLPNSKLISMAAVVGNKTIDTDCEQLGLVFPVFAWGLPRIVSEFVNKLSVKGKPYVFAVATCVAIPGNTLIELKALLANKGLDLNAGFAVSAARSSLMKMNMLDKVIIMLDHQRKCIKNGDTRLPEIVDTIKCQELHDPETSSWAANLFGSTFHKLAINSFKTIDKEFKAEGNCIGCGTCSKICPRSNIIIVNNRPVFKQNCELCHACIQWCPKFAIKHPNFDTSLSQQRNPNVLATELFQ